MYLIDTSVWIDYFRKNENSAVQHFLNILDKRLHFGITSIIYQEILQGADSAQDFKSLSDYLGSQQFFYPQDPILTYEKAAQLYFDCRRKGIELRSTIDCLIAQIAIENNLILLHNDKDYHQIKKINPALSLHS